MNFDLSSKIVIYGTGMECESFLYQHKGTLDVEFLIDKAPRRHAFRGLNVFNLESALREIKSWNKIVVATDIKEYQDVANRLKDFGLQEFVDFIYYKYIDKKLAIFYGNCQCDDMKKLLGKFDDFNKEYCIYDNFPMPHNNEMQYISPELLKYCDLFIYQTVNQSNNGYFYSSKYLLSQLSDSTLTIEMPNLYQKGFGFFPQSIKKPIALMRDTEYKYVNVVDGGDGIITQLYREEKTVSQIIEIIVNDTPFSEEYIVSNFNKWWNTIKEQDKHWDIKIWKWLNDNYQKKMIFIDPGHIQYEVFCEYVKQLFSILHIDCQSDISKIVSSTLQYHQRMPVYPCVAKVLGLKWATKDTLIKENSFTLTGAPIDLEEYIREYIYLCLDNHSI